MTRHPWLDPSPFYFERGPIGVLLIHGFTGAPTEMRPLGEYLAARGYTVAGPLLRGHGTTWQDMLPTRWQDWVGSAGVALTWLQRRSERVFVSGLSLGGLITLHLAAEHPDLAGLIPMAPAVITASKLIHLTPIARHVIRARPMNGHGNSDLTDPEAANRLWCYDYVPVAAAHQVLKLQKIVRRNLDRIHQPLLIFQGRHDRAVSPQSVSLVYARVGSGDKTLVWLENSGHCVTVDSERETVWQKTHQWIQQQLERSTGHAPSLR